MNAFRRSIDMQLRLARGDVTGRHSQRRAKEAAFALVDLLSVKRIKGFVACTGRLPACTTVNSVNWSKGLDLLEGNLHCMRRTTYVTRPEHLGFEGNGSGQRI
jgi:hypothetical protein